MEAALTMAEGKDLKAMDVTGKSDPFIVVKVRIVLLLVSGSVVKMCFCR
jgi:hypothetical protein